MCCILCEEPVRSITLGLAAIGIVVVVNGVRKAVANRLGAGRGSQRVRAPEMIVSERVDATP